jgi:hypothetical protein
VTTIEKFICLSCGLAGKPSRALEVCGLCQSAAVERSTERWPPKS